MLPLLPAHQVALDGEARPLGLDDLERLEVGAPELLEARGVVVLGQRHGRAAVVVDAHHLEPVEVDDDVQPLDRVGVAVVVLVVLDPDEDVRDAQVLLVGAAIAACGPGVDLRLSDVFDAASPERLGKARVGLDAVLHGRELFGHDRGPRTLDPAPGRHLGFSQVDHRLEHRVGCDVEQCYEGLARHRIARPPGAHEGLGRLLQLDGLEADRGAEPLLRLLRSAPPGRPPRLRAGRADGAPGLPLPAAGDPRVRAGRPPWCVASSPLSLAQSLRKDTDAASGRWQDVSPTRRRLGRWRPECPITLRRRSSLR